jgi:hypothetical protein
VRRASPTLALLLPAFALLGCNTLPRPPIEPPRTVVQMQMTNYPDLPVIELPLEPALLPWQYEVPRDMSRMVPKESAHCSELQKAGKDPLPVDCFENPVLRDTNLLFGFDQSNWNIMLSDLSKLREYIVQLKARIAVANASRLEWSEKARQERRKLDAARAEAANAATAKPTGTAP